VPSTAIDSVIFGEIFSTNAMRQVFSDENRTQKYLDVEAALAAVQGGLGIIPRSAADEIVRNCTLDKIDMSALGARTALIGYPVLGVVEQLVARCEDGAGEYCHWGATTQDITDTATVLQIRDALDIIGSELAAISASLSRLVRRYRATPMIGRSNLQQAVPITLGFKLAGVLSAVERHRTRLAELRPRVLVGELAGAAGTLASLGDRGLEVQAALMEALGLAQPEIAWHTSRDRIAEAGTFLALLTGTLGKFATDIKLLMQTEIGEVAEPFAHGRGSSSTMPQKRNPISSCYIHACASVVRQHAGALLDAMIADHERSTGPWEIEWIALPEAFLLTAGALAHARTIMDGLVIDTDRMQANLDLSQGLVVSEAVMMDLAPRVGRQHAHDLVYDLCRKAAEQQRPLAEVLAEVREVTDHLDAGHIARLCDPSRYLGLAVTMADKVVEAATASTQQA
jgi:3-carboxy-cis,cis-muconate cycloisomerase